MSKKIYTILFAFVLLILIALQGYYIYNSYLLEGKELRKNASEIAINVSNQIGKFVDSRDDEMINNLKKLSHEQGRQYNELNAYQIEIGKYYDEYKKKVDSLLANKTESNGYKIALKKEIYSIYDEINQKELLLNKSIVVFQSSENLVNPYNINQSVWTTDDIKNESDSGLGIDRKERHKYRIRSKTDYELLNINGLILKKIVPLIVISVLIVGFIIFLYWKSLQNLLFQEQKINQLHLTIDSIAHELNTPITTMKFALQNIENSESKEMMMRQLNRISSTVQAVFIKENNENTLVSESCIKEVIDNYQKQNTTIEFSHHLNFRQNNVLLEQDFIQLFQNLVENSIKYGATKIELNFEFSQKIILRFVDNGIGIPSKDLPFIFEKYFRVSRKINNQVNGLGVGLFLVKNCVDKYQGKIEILKGIDDGVEFKIVIPNEN